MIRASRRDLRDSLQQVAEGQAGYFTARQAIACGYSYPAQAYHAKHGNWLRIDRGIFRLRGWPTSDHEDLVRWSLWSRDRAVVSHDTALAVHDLGDLNPAQIHLTVPPGFRAKARGVVLHHGLVPEPDFERHTGYRITTPLRSILDVAETGIETERLATVLSDALRRGITTRREIENRAETAGAATALAVLRALERVGA